MLTFSIFTFSYRNFTVVNSKIIVVTIRPEPKTTDSFLEIELAHLSNVSTRIFDMLVQEYFPDHMGEKNWCYFKYKVIKYSLTSRI